MHPAPSSGCCALITLVLCAAPLAGCATRFEPLEETTPHAVLAVPSQEAQRESRRSFEPVEFNGLAQPRNWLRESFRIPPGEFRLLARVAEEALQGTCLLQFVAVAGETYRLDAALVGDTFTIRAINGGETVASCDAPATVLPTPARLPGAPLR